MRKGHSCISVIVVMLLLVGLSASAAYPGGAVTMCQPSPETIDPSKVRFTSDFGIACQVFEGLVEYNPMERRIVPCLAESWNVSSDGLSYTFTLKKGVLFHDGSPLTSADVKSSFERFMSNSQLSYIKEIVRGVKAKDELTVEVNLVQPVGFFIASLASILITPTRYAGASVDWRKPVGTGPFRVKEWSAKKSLSLVRNDTYHQTGLPYLDSVHFEFGQPKPVEALAKGQVSAVGLPYYSASSWMADDFYRNYIKVYRDLGIHYVSINTKKTPFNDRRVRQALNHLLNLPAAGLTPGVEFVRLGGVLSPDMPGFSSAAAPYEFSLQAAKDLLAKAGFKDGKGFPKLTLICPTADDKAIYDLAWGKYLKMVGIGYSSIVLTMAEIDDRQAKGNYTLMAGSWAPDYADPDAMFYTLFHPESVNRVGFQSSEVTSLVEKGRSLVNSAERDAVYTKLQTTVRELAPMLFGWSEILYTAVDMTLVNWEPVPSAHIPLMKHVWSDRPRTVYSTTQASQTPPAFSEALRALADKNYGETKLLLSEARVNFPALANHATVLRLLVDIAQARMLIKAGARADTDDELLMVLSELAFEEQFLTLPKGKLEIPFTGFEFEELPWAKRPDLKREDIVLATKFSDTQSEFALAVKAAEGLNTTAQATATYTGLPSQNLNIKPEYLYALMAETCVRARFVPEFILWLYDKAIDYAKGNTKLIDAYKKAKDKVEKEASTW